jgi:hypothetical protein
MPKKPKAPARAAKKPAKPEPLEGNLSEVARVFGKSVSVLRRAIETNGVAAELFPAGPSGRRSVPDFTAAVEAFGAYLENPPPLGRPKAPKGPRVVDVSFGALEMPEGFDVENPETWPLDLDGLKVVREWWIARHAKRKDDLAAGELVRAEEVRRQAFSAARTARDHFLRLVDRMAEDLAAESDAELVRGILTAAIERILVDYSAALNAIAAEQSDDAEEEDAA